MMPNYGGVHQKMKNAPKKWFLEAARAAVLTGVGVLAIYRRAITAICGFGGAGRRTAVAVVPITHLDVVGTVAPAVTAPVRNTWRCWLAFGSVFTCEGVQTGPAASSTDKVPGFQASGRAAVSSIELAEFSVVNRVACTVAC